MWWGDLFEFNGFSSDTIKYYFGNVTYNDEYFSVASLNIYTNVIEFYGDLEDIIPEKKIHLNRIFTLLGDIRRRGSDIFCYDVVYKDVKYSHACINVNGSVTFYTNEDDKDCSYYVSSFFSNEEKTRDTNEEAIFKFEKPIYPKNVMDYYHEVTIPGIFIPPPPPQ